MVSTIGTTNTLSFVKIREVTLQNLGDLIWNDPHVMWFHLGKHIRIRNGIYIHLFQIMMLRTLQTTDQKKYVGLIFDTNLSWNFHFSNICKKLYCLHLLQ